ncbi:hypothetical protein Dimus_008453 [Dionaea muscipula]
MRSFRDRFRDYLGEVIVIIFSILVEHLMKLILYPQKTGKPHFQSGDGIMRPKFHATLTLSHHIHMHIRRNNHKNSTSPHRELISLSNWNPIGIEKKQQTA